MALDFNKAAEQEPTDRHAAFGVHDFDAQCLRILRCTARAMARSPGGLRFKAGTRPWLDGLAGARPALPTPGGRRIHVDFSAAGESEP